MAAGAAPHRADWTAQSRAPPVWGIRPGPRPDERAADRPRADPIPVRSGPRTGPGRRRPQSGGLPGPCRLDHRVGGQQGRVRAPSGDAESMQPPTMPRWRICGKPTVRDAMASPGSRSPSSPSFRGPHHGPSRRTARVARSRDLRGHGRDLLTGRGTERQLAPRQLHRTSKQPRACPLIRLVHRESPISPTESSQRRGSALATGWRTAWGRVDPHRDGAGPWPSGGTEPPEREIRPYKTNHYYLRVMRGYDPCSSNLPVGN